MAQRLDDSLDQIDFASAKKGKAVTADRIKQYDEGLITEGEAMGVLVPSAPITTKEPDVIKLLIRTALQRAAREDYDAISFPSGEVMSTIDAIDPGQKGITIYDKILPKEINKIMKKIGGKKYDDDNYFTKKEFYDYIEDHPAVHKVLPYANEIDNLHFLEGHGNHKGFFDIAFLPHYATQRFLNYHHNGIDKTQFELI